MVSEELEDVQQGTLHDRFVVTMSQRCFVGVGHAGTVFRGFDVRHQKPVAIKFVKRRSEKDFQAEAVRLKKIQAGTAFAPPPDPLMWCSDLQHARRSETFVRMLAHSMNEDGTPGRDLESGTNFMVLELGDCDLRQFLQRHLEGGQGPAAAAIKAISRDILLAVAGLHSLGLGHQDIKPRNFVLSEGRWKLIDFGGSRDLGQILGPQGSTTTVLYSPPEWCSRELRHEPLPVTAEHDVWGAGLTLVELVTLQGLLKQIGEEFLGRTPDLAWIADLQRIPVPVDVLLSPHAAFVARVCADLLPCDPRKRKTAAQVLESDLFADLEPGCLSSAVQRFADHGTHFLV